MRSSLLNIRGHKLLTQSPSLSFFVFHQELIAELELWPDPFRCGWWKSVLNRNDNINASYTKMRSKERDCDGKSVHYASWIVSGSNSRRLEKYRTTCIRRREDIFFKFNKALTRSTFCDVVDVRACLDQTKYRRQHVCCLISASLRLDIVLTR